MPPTVYLSPIVQRKLEDNLHDQICEELAKAFDNRCAEVTAHDLIVGFSNVQREKVILAVETSGRPDAQDDRDDASGLPAHRMHIVKIGRRDQVEADALGWQQCVRNRPVPQRMFVPVRLCNLNHISDRFAVVYQDATQWYGLTRKDEGEQVATLEWAVNEAIFSAGKVRLDSVQRVIRQVFRELQQWFYSLANADVEAAGNFYGKKLRLPDCSATGVNRWKEDPDLWELRRDVVWLLCGHHPPDSPTLPEYVDPYDYVLWALEQKYVPPTLVGPSHGDLHGRNIIVGVSRDEAEFPVVIDYGDMSDGNAVVWDFVKLEGELKVRLLAELDGRGKLDSLLRNVIDAPGQPHFQKLLDHWQASPGTDRFEARNRQILAAYEFERRLTQRTLKFRETPAADRLLGATDDSPFEERALKLLLSIRHQAAQHLGQNRPEAPHSDAAHWDAWESWLKEYYFGLAVYSLNTAKFSSPAYEVWHRIFALVSGGCAAARFESLRKGYESAFGETAPPPPYACYVIPMYHGYKHWKEKKPLPEAEHVFRTVAEKYDYSIPFRREYALVLAAHSRDEERNRALQELMRITRRFDDRSSPDLTRQEIIERCRSFCDIEVLSRIGRIHKDRADEKWKQLDVSFEELPRNPPADDYASSYRYYDAAFRISKDYYPGCNAAVTASLAHKQNEAARIASEVLDVCTRIELERLSTSDKYWVRATRGDMLLLTELPDSAGAAAFYETALAELPAESGGMVQASYNQLCRLYKALGEKLLRPVVEVFVRQSEKFQLDSGPLGDCGGSMKRV